MKENVKEFLKNGFFKTINTESNKQSERKIRSIVCFALAIVSTILTIFNIVNCVKDGNLFMTVTTSVLTILFLVSGFIIVKTSNAIIPGILIFISVSAAFSIYAINGENEGFAIIWILLVPLISMLFISVPFGTVMSLFFLLFLLIIFYTPLRDIIPGSKFYTETFKIRFPVLYFADLVLSLLLSIQKNYYSNMADRNSLFDPLTKLKNRRYFNDFVASCKNLDQSFTVVSIDMNNLKNINDIHGHTAGDKAINYVADSLTKVFTVESKTTEMIFRFGGDEFIVFLEDKDDSINKLLTNIKKEISAFKIGEITLSISAGYAKAKDYPDSTLEFLSKVAEKEMYKDKNKFYASFYGRRRDDYYNLNK